MSLVSKLTSPGAAARCARVSRPGAELTEVEELRMAHRVTRRANRRYDAHAGLIHLKLKSDTGSECYQHSRAQLFGGDHAAGPRTW